MKYIINETQYRSLISRNRAKKIANEILEEIERTKKNLNESMVNEGVIDTLRKYVKRGVLSAGVIATLLANNVSAQDLVKAGVPVNDIRIAQQTDKHVNTQAVEKAIINNLKRAGEKGTLKQFLSLDQQTKTNVINAVVNQTGGDIGKLSKMDLSLYLNRSGELAGDQYTQVGESTEIIVDTIYVDMIRDFSAEFSFNSAKLENPEQVQAQFQSYLNSFNSIDKITIVASSSTLRNTGEFEGTSWKQSSQLRVDAVKKLLVGMEYNLGGCGANESHTVTDDMIKQSINGTNGDGTSGPQSPFEIDERMINSYSDRGIDSTLWKSASQEAPLFDIEDLKSDKSLIRQYKKYQYVKVVISGDVVGTATEEIVNLSYLKMEAKKDGTTIKRNPKGKQQKVKVLSCPIVK